MTDDKRFHKPELPRQGPIRNWSTLLGSFAPRSHAADSGAPPNDNGSGATPDSVVSRAVELGYQVIEEQIRQGQRAAEQLSQGRIDPGMVGGNISELAERLLRVSSDVAALWLEVMNSIVRNPAMSDFFEKAAGMPPGGAGNSGGAPPGANAGDTPGGAFHGAPGGNGASAPPSHTGSVNLAIEIVSSVPTGARVSVDIHSPSDHGALAFSPLRARDEDKPPLTDISLVPASAEWPASLRVTIPAGQPAGTYAGLVINETTDEPVGTLCARIPESDRA